MLAISSPLKRLDLRKLKQITPSDIPRPSMSLPDVRDLVREILKGVRERGDQALKDYTERYDGTVPIKLVYHADDFERAARRIDPELYKALELAHSQVWECYSHELPAEESYMQRGIRVSRRIVPVSRAACYVPGGRARYPSSVIHSATVARVAGVSQVVIATPPMVSGTVDDATLAACHIAGVDLALAAGGAQAIAALAYGTESVPACDVIVGPGNVFVSIAKQEVAATVGIPSAFAGPSEVVVVADGSVDPRLSAIDVAVQAEHGPNGLAWLVSWDLEYLDRVNAELDTYLMKAPRSGDIRTTLAEGGYGALVRDRQQALELVNLIAPEHLELLYDQAGSDVAAVTSAGAIFLGELSSAAFGDYVAGPSHVLPTFGTARFGSVLSVDDFVKKIHTIEVTEQGVSEVGSAAEVLARTEGLYAHEESVRLRR